MQVQSIKVLLNQTWIREIWCSSWMEGLRSGRSPCRMVRCWIMIQVPVVLMMWLICVYQNEILKDVAWLCDKILETLLVRWDQLYLLACCIAENSYYWSLALRCDVMACEWIAVCVFDNFLSLPSLLSSFKISTFLYASLWFMPSGIADQWRSDAAPGTRMQSKATQALIHACQVALTCCPSLFGEQLTDVFTLGKRLHRHESLQSSKWFTMTLKSAGPRPEPWQHQYLLPVWINSCRYVWLKQHRDQGVQQKENECTDITCWSSRLSWMSFFSTECEIIVSVLLWLGAHGPATLIRESGAHTANS